MREDLFNKYNLNPSFSLESDFLEKYIKEIKPSFSLTENFFIDIGVKSDYLKARKILSNLASNIYYTFIKFNIRFRHFFCSEKFFKSFTTIFSKYFTFTFIFP